MSEEKTSKRKVDHIELAFKSQADEQRNFGLFYEPMLSSMEEEVSLKTEIAGKELEAPLWISSMTGGAGVARDINKNLAIAAGKTGIGMGLGSCRPLLYSDDRLEDFALREYVQQSVLFANLGVAQVEELLSAGEFSKIKEMIKKIDADGLMIHVNPLQEYAQPEGDTFKEAPLDTIKRVLDALDKPLIIKEVGQGMGPRSLEELCKLPLEAIEFGAYGGTNFTKLEQTRHKSLHSGKKNELLAFASMGHTPSEMVGYVNDCLAKPSCKVGRFIISGGIKNVVEGHGLRMRLKGSGIIGMAQAYLREALISADAVQGLIEEQIDALKMASRYLK